MITAWKTVRVFISSTFRDMQAERDHLVRFVFPRLREELLKFRIHLEDVDLRWGVTSEQDAFDLCMKEIDNCHPRFICILGGRYGWVPPPKEIPADFLDSVFAGASAAGSLTPAETNALHALYLQANGGRNYRLKEKPRTIEEVEGFNARGEIAVGVLQRAGLPEAQRSITASEIQYGSLDKLQRPTFRFFYFREERVTNAIPEAFAKDYREPVDSPAARFLDAIKARIKDPATRGQMLVAPGQEVDRPLTWHVYPCEWDTASSRIIKLKEFGEMVYNDLLTSVKAQFGDAPESKEAQTDEEKFAEENAAMEAFVEEGNERFVLGSRETALNELLAHASATGGNGHVCLTGAPGSGKSALLAHLSRHSILNNQPSTLLIRHFVGASPGSTDVRRTQRRLCHELKAGCSDITDDITDDPEKLRVAFPDFLRQACARQRVVILLDAVNQFDPASYSAGLHWLPEELPDNARIILSALDGPALEELRRRRHKPREIELKPLTTADGEAVIEQFRERYRKKFEPDQRAALLAKTDAGKPLYLLAALEELRTLGTYEQITKRIRRMPSDTESLFKWILKRLQRDKGFRDSLGKRIGRELVSDFAALLGASRHGLSQRELADLLAPGDAKAQFPIEPDLQGNVAALLRLLRPYLMRRGELLDFYHDQFRRAAKNVWLNTDAQPQAAHAQLADYFDTRWREPYDHALSELPFHLHQTEGQMWQKLVQTLTDIHFMDSKIQRGMLFPLLEDYEFSTKNDRIPDLDQMYRILTHSLSELRRNPESLAQSLHNRIVWSQDPALKTATIMQGIDSFLSNIPFWIRATAPLPDPSAGFLQTAMFDSPSPIQSFSRHSNMLAVALPKGNTVIYRLPHGNLVRSTTLSSDRVAAISLSPDSTELAYRDRDGTVMVEGRDPKLAGRPGETAFVFRSNDVVVAVNSGNDLVAWSPQQEHSTVLASGVLFPLRVLKDCHQENSVFFVAGTKAQQIGIFRLTAEGWNTRMVDYSGPEIVDADIDLGSGHVVLLLKNRSIRVMDISTSRTVSEVQYTQPKISGPPLRIVLSNDNAYFVTDYGNVGRWKWRESVLDHIANCYEKTEHSPLAVIDAMELGNKLILSFPTHALLLSQSQSHKTTVRHNGRATRCIIPKGLNMIVSASKDENMIRWFTLGMNPLGNCPCPRPTSIAQVGETDEVLVGTKGGAVLRLSLTDHNGPPREHRVSPHPISDIVCLDEEFCLAVDASGRFLEIAASPEPGLPLPFRNQLKAISAKDSNGVWSLYESGNMWVFSYLDRRMREQVIVNSKRRIRDAAVSRNGQRLCVAGDTLTLYDLHRRNCELAFQSSDCVRIVDFIDDDFIVVVPMDGGDWLEVRDVRMNLEPVAAICLKHRIQCIDTAGSLLVAGLESGDVVSMSFEGNAKPRVIKKDG